MKVLKTYEVYRENTKLSEMVFCSDEAFVRKDFIKLTIKAKMIRFHANWLYIHVSIGKEQVWLSNQRPDS